MPCMPAPYPGGHRPAAGQPTRGAGAAAARRCRRPSRRPPGRRRCPRRGAGWASRRSAATAPVAACAAAEPGPKRGSSGTPGGAASSTVPVPGGVGHERVPPGRSAAARSAAASSAGRSAGRSAVSAGHAGARRRAAPAPCRNAAFRPAPGRRAPPGRRARRRRRAPAGVVGHHQDLGHRRAGQHRRDRVVRQRQRQLLVRHAGHARRAAGSSPRRAASPAPPRSSSPGPRPPILPAGTAATLAGRTRGAAGMISAAGMRGRGTRRRWGEGGGVARRRLGFWRRFAVALVKPVLIVLDPARPGRAWRTSRRRRRDHRGQPPLARRSAGLAHYVYDAGRWPQFLAKASVFRVPVVGWILHRCRQIPVERGTRRRGQVAGRRWSPRSTTAAPW